MTARVSRYNGLAGNARRREHAMRSNPLVACACIRDPDHDRHRCCDDELSPRMVDAARNAANHIIGTGCAPILKHDLLRELGPPSDVPPTVSPGRGRRLP